jgi:hypothetical protein
MLRRFAWVITVIFVFSIGGGLRAGARQQPGSSSRLAPSAAQTEFLKTYCIGCHNQKIKSAGLSLDNIRLDDAATEAAVLEKVVRKLRARAMPPIGRPRPDDKTYDSFVSVLESALDHAAEAAPNPGRIDTFRRLTRAEYRNAIRELLDLDIDVSALLPKDDVSHGFDNVNTGGLSPTLMERYLSAALKISRLAVGSPIRAGGDTIILPPDLTQEDHFDGLPFGTRGGAIVRHYFPLDAEYDFQIRLTRDRNEQIEGLTEPHEAEVLLDGAKVGRFTLRPNPRGAGQAQSDYYSEDKGDAGLRFRIPVKAGPHALTVTFIKRPSALLETERQPYLASFNLDRHPRTQPALHSVSIAGPFDPQGSGDTPSRKRIFGCTPTAANEAACARQIISTLARRAYRRPVTEDDIQLPLDLFRTARTEGNFDAGVEAALQTILSSPKFLFRIEQEARNGPSAGTYRISDVDLASRLSFFLWSSIPDDELLNLAISGKLKDPAVLEAQVKRMLKDRRAEALVTNFAGQWLYLRNLAAVSPDPRQFPDFDDNLRQGFRRETELFFESIMKEDRNVLDLLTADYTFVNERVARHYGIPNILGDRFRRVSLTPESRRSGLLGHGSILTVTSYANRTSPVLRGKWILENILGSTVPEPPPNVPPLGENTDTLKVLTMRERMVQHRVNPACAGCHQLMDPVGLSMENFDAIGRWRSEEAGAAVDASGGLPDGSSFDGVQGLRKALMGRPDLFVSAFSEKILTYALGRGVEYYDVPAIRKIIRDAKREDYRFSSIVLGVVNSIPFRMRRPQ